jgi:hypothetical protein
MIRILAVAGKNSYDQNQAGSLVPSCLSQQGVVPLRMGTKETKPKAPNFLELAQLNVCLILLTFPENQ